MYSLNGTPGIYLKTDQVIRPGMARLTDRIPTLSTIRKIHRTHTDIDTYIKQDYNLSQLSLSLYSSAR